MKQEEIIKIYQSRIRHLKTEVAKDKELLEEDFTYNLPLYGKYIFIRSILIGLYDRAINHVSSLESFQKELEEYLFTESNVKFGSTNIMRNVTNQYTYEAYLKCYNELKRLTES